MMDHTAPSERTVISPPFSSEVTASAPSSINATTIKTRLTRRRAMAMAANYRAGRGETRMAADGITRSIGRAVLPAEALAGANLHVDIGITARTVLRPGTDFQIDRIGPGFIYKVMPIRFVLGKDGAIARRHALFAGIG